MAKSIKVSPFSQKLLTWFDQHGRKTLPWQRNRDPYYVWISEIMLQQTQVKAVIPYFERFIEQFPSIDDLASADTDSVMHYWSGLGYYARARNLHKAAKLIVADHGSNFPEDIDSVVALPGIGRSTAAAILAFCFGQHHAILDGNVKRVLTRYYAIEGYPGKRTVEQSLWQRAEELTPKQRVGDYTQAIMDLGATLCTRSRPGCENCPMADDCAAKKAGSQALYPFRKPKTKKPQKSVTMLLIQQPSGEILLEKRPASGIWGGLWSLPEKPESSESAAHIASCLGLQTARPKQLDPMRHGFTHFELLIQPELVRVTGENLQIMDADNYLWYNLSDPQSIGLPAIISKLLGNIARESETEPAGICNQETSVTISHDQNSSLR